MFGIRRRDDEGNGALALRNVLVRRGDYIGLRDGEMVIDSRWSESERGWHVLLAPSAAVPMVAEEIAEVREESEEDRFQ